MHRIKVDFGAIKQLAIECACTRVTVTNALNCITNTPKAREIRALAVAKYGGMHIKSVEVEPLS